MADSLLSVALSTHYALRSPIVPFAISQGINSRTVGVHTGGGDFLWKRYQPVHAEASILYEHRLLGWLAARELSFAVPVPLPNRAGDTLWVQDGSFHALFPFIPGGPVDYGNPRQLANVGAGLAELQSALAGYPTEPRPTMTGFSALTGIHPTLPHPHFLQPADLGLAKREPFTSLLTWLREEVSAVQGFIDGLFQALPQQIIHGDFVPSNTLHAGDRLAGIVDFEFAGPDVRAMDVASGLYYSLRVWERDDPWPRSKAFAKGFGKRTQLTDAEIAAQPWLMRLRNVVSKIFWLGKSLADGTAEETILEIRDLEIFNLWLDENNQRVERLFAE